MPLPSMMMPLSQSGCEAPTSKQTSFFPSNFVSCVMLVLPSAAHTNTSDTVPLVDIDCMIEEGGRGGEEE